jgi:cobalamin biosynthesis Mg chelatase CobN
MVKKDPLYSLFIRWMEFVVVPNSDKKIIVIITYQYKTRKKNKI